MSTRRIGTRLDTLAASFFAFVRTRPLCPIIGFGDIDGKTKSVAI